MSTKLSSDLNAIIEQLTVIEGAYSELLTSLETWQERAEKAEGLLGLVDTVSSLHKIKEAAEKRGLSPREWITEKLLEACEPKSELPIDPLIYKSLQGIATGRGISLKDLGQSVDFTQILRESLENRRI